MRCIQGRAVYRAGAGDVTDRAKADGFFDSNFAVFQRCQLGDGDQQALAFNDLTLVRVVQRWQLDFFTFDVLPHVKFGPVGDRKHAEMLAGLNARIEQRPQLGALGFGLPLTESVAVREDAFLGAGFFLIPAGAANQRIKAKFVNRFQQRHGLVHIARLARVCKPHSATFHGIFNVAHNQFGAQLFGAVIAKIGHFLEVVAGVYHQQRIRNAAAALRVYKSLLGAFEQDQRVLAA